MKKALLIMAFLMICGSAFSQIEPVEKTKDYWVYVRLEDRSGVTSADDAGRSKAGDVVDVVKADGTNTASDLAKKEWMIYKTAITEEKRNELLESWEEGVGDNKTLKAYRKNKLDTSKLGVDVKIGLVEQKIDASKILTSEKTSFDLTKYEKKRKVYVYIKRPAAILYEYIEYAFDYWTMPAYAFSTTTCADNDTEDREQICTVNKTGEDYASLTLWEDAKDGDLVTDKQIRTAEVYSDDGILDNFVVINGSTTSADYYMKVTSAVEDRHEGIYDETKAMIERDIGAEEIIEVSDEYFVIEWLQFKRGTHPATGGERKTIYYTALASSPQICRNNIFKFNVDSGDENASVISGIRIFDSSTVVYTMNNIFIGAESTGTGTVTTAMYALSGDPAGNYFYNNTVIDMAYGTYETTPIIKNSVFQDCTVDSSAPDSTSDYNLTDIAEASSGFNGVGTHNVFESTLTFESAVGDDYHLVSTDTDAIDAGVDLGTTSGVNIDIDARDRDSEGDTWDIGADEFVSAAPSGAPPQIW